MKEQKSFGLILKGAAMGMAEVIPGVSGGTIAFITGIYEQLLNSIKAIGPELFAGLKNDGIKGAWEAINGKFLLFLLMGMVGGIVVGVFGISYLLETFPPVVWAFFCGLILASVVYIAKQATSWGIVQIACFMLATVFAYFLTTAIPSEGSSSYPYVFGCGMIAISALILPGISGSFILLLMGMYTYIVQDTLKGVLSTFALDKIITMGVFALGCLTGLATISRLLSWTFDNYKNSTLAVLSGFMLGSLNKIWPWRKATEWLRDSNGNIILDDDGLTPKKILSEINISPSAYSQQLQMDNYLIFTILAFIAGMAIVFIMDRNNRSNHG